MIVTSTCCTKLHIPYFNIHSLMVCQPDINTKITTTQIAINYVKAKGAVPLISVTNPKEANELLGCLGWELNDDEVAELDKACKVCGL